MRRVVVKGGSGSGKSTLAAALAGRLGVPYVEPDALHHGPNWTAPTTDEFPRAISSHFGYRRAWPALLQGRPVVTLRTPREVDDWLSTQRG